MRSRVVVLVVLVLAGCKSEPVKYEEMPDGGCDTVLHTFTLAAADYAYWQEHMQAPPGSGDSGTTGADDCDDGSPTTGDAGTGETNALCEAICDHLAPPHLGIDRCWVGDPDAPCVTVRCRVNDECT